MTWEIINEKNSISQLTMLCNSAEILMRRLDDIDTQVQSQNCIKGL